MLTKYRNLHSWAYEYYVGFTRQFWTNFPLASFAGRSFAEAAYVRRDLCAGVLIH